jgi:L-amino acid N-acyltransferase YncA
MYRIRTAILEDLARIVEIYNQAIRATKTTGDTIAFTVESRREWFNAHSKEQYPIYVCDDEGGEVSGFLSLSPYRDRPAMARTAEVSYYVDYGCHGKGIGTALMQYAVEDCKRLGKRILVAIVLEWNQPSIKMLEKFGFEKWGYLPDVAEFDGQTCGHYYYGLKLNVP